jgi:RNA polymerase sigma factor (sigma-70 family)
MPTSYSNSFWQRVHEWLGDQPDHASDDAQLLERFVASKDEAVFQTLVERHGPMVWGVCRRVLRHSQDAEDAFQATFLILLMRADAIRKRGSVGSWLYGVALRTAQRARVQASQRHARETAVSAEATAPVAVAATQTDPALEEELARLPEKYRLPLVLCYYQGQTLEDAAQNLGWPLGTVAGRMSRAREQLRQRLQRRGVTLSAATVVAALVERASAALPPELAEQTLYTSLAWLTPGKSVPAPVLSLAQGVMQIMFWSRVKLACVMVIFLGLMTVSAGLLWSRAGQVLGADPSTAANPAGPLELVRQEVPLRDQDDMEGGFVTLDNGVNNPAELKGTVLLPDGKPAAVAKVWAASLSYDNANRYEVTTAADGSFRLTLPRTIKPQWFVAARLGRMGGEAHYPTRAVIITPDTKQLIVTIRLEERGTLRGKVVAEENGQPLGGAKMYFDGGEVAVTDKNGAFQMGGLPLRNHHVIVVAPGRQRPYLHFDTSLRPDAELEVRLAQGGKVTGTVTDEEGKPLGGVLVQRVGSGKTTTLHGWVETTDAQGRFVWDGLPLDRKADGLRVFKPGYRVTHGDELQMKAGETPVLNFRLHRFDLKTTPTQDQPTAKRTVKGVVTKPDGQPVANAMVRWGISGSQGDPTTFTNAQGKFTLVEIPDRKGRLTVLADEFAPALPEVPTGDTTVEIKLLPGQDARGVVRDHRGRPVAGVRIVPLIPRPEKKFYEPFWLPERETTTDAEGKFVLRGSSPTDMAFDFRHPNLATEGFVYLKQGEALPHIVMKPTGAVRGVVIDSDGKPVRNFSIRRYLGSTEVHFTSADGTFVLSDSHLKGPVTLIATAPGHGRAVQTGVQVLPLTDLAEGKPVVFQLTKPHTLKVHVTAATPQGLKPVADAVVGFTHEFSANFNRPFSWGYDDRFAVRHRTDARGDLALTNLTFPEATVIVEAPGYGRRYLIWREGERELAITLEPEAQLSGVVQRENRPLSEYNLSLQSNQHGQFTVDVNAANRGRFMLNGLPGGEYTLQVREGDAFIRTQTVRLAAGEKKELPIELKPTERPLAYSTTIKK